MWKLDCEESWVPKNWCFWTVVLEKTLESPLDCKEVQAVHHKGDQSRVFFGRSDAKAETPVLWPPHAELTHWKRLWCWEELGAGGEGDDREWDGWMASLTWWTWVSVNSRRWWWTGRPGVLRFMGSQRVRHDRVTDLIWSDWSWKLINVFCYYNFCLIQYFYHDCVLICSFMSNSLQSPWTVAHQATLSIAIIQARMLEWVAIPSSRGSSQSGALSQVSHISRLIFSTQYSNQGLLHCRWILYQLRYQGRPYHDWSTGNNRILYHENNDTVK